MLTLQCQQGRAHRLSSTTTAHTQIRSSPITRAHLGTSTSLTKHSNTPPLTMGIFSSKSKKTTASRRAMSARASSGQPLKVMIAGAPAAGKGTQCAKIVEKYGLVHISVGDLLRAEVVAGTPAGKKAKSFMDNGDLVPNEVVVEMVKGKLNEPIALQKGWLLDGYPRSGDQAEAIEAENIRPDVFLLINVPDDMLVDRVVGRRVDPVTNEIYHLTFKPPPPEIISRLEQRSDDTEEKVRNRLQTHHKNVDAVVGYYKDVMVEIDGNKSMDEVFGAVVKAIEGAGRGEEKKAATA
jgi:adenylate kinase